MTMAIRKRSVGNGRRERTKEAVMMTSTLTLDNRAVAVLASESAQMAHGLNVGCAGGNER